ncbi:unnamed protein product [Trichobilharzia regenti]|nr:unnamed protein product [Trichobilharzia regenti]
MTVNPKISIQQSGKPPPLYVCLDCADALNRLDFDQLVDILLPTKQSSLPDVWDMSIDSQPCMIQSIISLTLETMPRWRQVLLGGVENGDEVTNRAVTGLTCPGPSAPGGPTSSNEMVMLGLSSGTIISSNLSGNPMANTTTVTVGGGVVAQTSFSDFGTAQMTGFTTRNQTGAGVTSSGGIAGVANGYGHNSGAETGAITLLGRYRDEDHKVLAVYGAFLVGEKCRPRERINLVS